MRTVSASILAVAVLTATAACSPPSSPSPGAASGSPASSVSAAPSSFHRLGYSFVVPPGWTAQEGSLDWEAVGGPPRLGLPTFDSFTLSAEADPRILIGSRPVRDSAPLDDWIAQMRALKVITYPDGGCNAAEDQRPATVDGEAAEMVAFHCPTDGPKAVVVQLLVRHADQGWVLQCFSATGKAGSLSGLEHQCQRWLGSFRFAQ